MTSVVPVKGQGRQQPLTFSCVLFSCPIVASCVCGCCCVCSAWINATVWAATVSGCAKSAPGPALPAGGVGVVGMGDGAPCTKAAAAAKPVWLVGSGVAEAAVSGCWAANTSKSCRRKWKIIQSSCRDIYVYVCGVLLYSPAANVPHPRDPGWKHCDFDSILSPFPMRASLSREMNVI